MLDVRILSRAQIYVSLLSLLGEFFPEFKQNPPRRSIPHVLLTDFIFLLATLFGILNGERVSLLAHHHSNSSFIFSSIAFAVRNATNLSMAAHPSFFSLMATHSVQIALSPVAYVINPSSTKLSQQAVTPIMPIVSNAVHAKNRFKKSFSPKHEMPSFVWPVII